MLSGWGYALLLRALDKTLIRHAPRRRKFAVGAAVAVLLVIQLPNAWTALNDTWQLTLPDQRNFLATWADGTLPASKYITNSVNRKTLNSSWGGYAGETRFDYADSISSDATIAEWRAQDVLFAIVSYGQYDLWREEGIDEFATQTTLLKSYPPSDAFRGPAMVVLLLHPIQHQATGKLGPIRLIGYDLPSRTASAGQSLNFHLYWQAEAATATNYQVFNHLLNAEGNLVAQIDGPPLPSERRGTIDWSDPEEILYSRQFALALPEDLPSGEYTLVTGFYRRDNGQRLLTPTGEDFALCHHDKHRIVSGQAMVGIGTTSSEVDGGRRFWPQPFWPPRNWWLALLVILVLAGALRFRAMVSAFRILTNPMNPISFFRRMIIDFGTAKSLNNQFYPPGIISIYYVVFRLFHDPTTPPGSVVGIVRILAIITSLGVIVVIGLFGYHGLGQVAGLLGAAIWSITPLFVENSRWGTAEIWVVFFAILALYCTTVAILYRRERLVDICHICADVGHPFQIPLHLHCTIRALRTIMARVYLKASRIGQRGALCAFQLMVAIAHACA